jgi:DNA-binding beta-propeller fold protein YncE
LQQPAFVAVDPSGKVFVADAGNNRIAVFAPQ